MMYEWMNPVCLYAGELHELQPAGESTYADDAVRVDVKKEFMTTGREKLICRWMNLTDAALRCQPEIRLRTTFAFTHYLIPGVSCNGNHWGKGKEPKGLLYADGKPWTFDYRRTTIPACTISGNDNAFLALMASDADAASLTASCCMEPESDGRMIHHLLYPEIERPVTYCTRDGYTGPHEEFIMLEPGKAFVTAAYILTGKPYAPNFAAAQVEDAALDLLGKPFPNRYTTDEVAHLASLFARRLVMNTNNRKMFSIGQLPNDQGVFENRPGHDIGWCGQNGMLARLMLERGLAADDEKLVEIGLSNLDAWSHEAVSRQGLIRGHYHWMLDGRSGVEDTCGLGFAIAELTQAWRLMHRHGKEYPDWLGAARSTADFLIAHWTDRHGFGKAWDTDTGTCADPEGTIGAYVIPGLTELYRATGEKAYLDAARRACRFYRDRDLNRFSCTAGALDTYCIDKESSGPLLAGALELYDIEPTEEWLDCARKAGWYFCSWMFHHDTLNSPDSDFVRYGYRTLGGTSVSAQHHHIDPWGALVVPQMVKLWKITGDEHWRRRAQLMWANAIQMIAPEEGRTIHGHFRAAGAQNEGYHHCHWGDEGAPGLINEWLVAWPQAFCWNTAVKVDQTDLAE